MQAYEFNTVVHDGIINIPEQFIEYNLSNVRVILLADSVKKVSQHIDVKDENRDTSTNNISNFPFSAGLWEDYDIDDLTLRSKAWGTQKRAVL